MTTYGIYIAYPAEVDLRAEGLGRYLASFLKGAAGRNDTKFVLACPSWARENLALLFESEGVQDGLVEIMAPKRRSLKLSIFETYKKRLDAQARGAPGGKFWQWLSWPRVFLAAKVRRNMMVFTSASSLGRIVWSGVFAVGWLTAWVAWAVASLFWRVLYLTLRIGLKLWARAPTALHRRVAHYNFAARLRRYLSTHEREIVAALYDAEIRRMHRLIEKRDDIAAWYCQAAFWPSFNDIRAPRLVCVPDVVLAHFPIGFAKAGGEGFLRTFEKMVPTIKNASRLVVYSDVVKWDTLVSRFDLAAEKISVVRHAAHLLDSAFVGVDLASGLGDAQCRNYLLQAIRRGGANGYLASFANERVRFIFYASQFRPHKNLITLLRAYVYLLRRRYFGHKLILTGRVLHMPEVGEFIRKHRLENDVLCLPQLSVQELAACYRLADVAVNPSFSEGGCPFTFTEALSVGTPVVMARIRVTEEVLDDLELQRLTFFDPYDWRDLVRRLEWALANREYLLQVQMRTHAQLKKRTWADVVSEHIAILEEMSLAT